jgi:hypothetical protein
MSLYFMACWLNNYVQTFRSAVKNKNEYIPQNDLVVHGISLKRLRAHIKSWGSAVFSNLG